MQFDFKKNMLTKTQLIASVGIFWQKSYKTIFFVSLVCVIFLSAYIWQKSLSGGEWSPEKKQEYLNVQNTGVFFRENDFKKALVDIEARKNDIANEQQPIKDIFKAY